MSTKGKGSMTVTINYKVVDKDGNLKREGTIKQQLKRGDKYDSSKSDSRCS